MIIEPFKPEHLDAIELQDASLIGPIKGQLPMYVKGEAWTVITNRIICCSGLVPTTLGAHLWAVIARDAPMIVLHKIALRAFGTYRLRISATVEATFLPGCRWLEMLGFERVAIASEYGHDGCDHYVYVRTP